jgi:hypothetical protein
MDSDRAEPQHVAKLDINHIKSENYASTPASEVHSFQSKQKLDASCFTTQQLKPL